jgi:hypothetical protein
LGESRKVLQSVLDTIPLRLENTEHLKERDFVQRPIWRGFGNFALGRNLERASCLSENRKVNEGRQRGTCPY